MNDDLNLFMPLVEAFKDMCNLFECSSCGGMLKVISDDNEYVGVRCRCEQENWNLVVKGKN